jgi:FtsP/CotA-like multicopper oxidase with cupredoxin domain
MSQEVRVPRRQLLQAGAAGAGLMALAGAGVLGVRELGSKLRPAETHVPAAEAANFYIEAWPTSPLIVNPFNDPLPIPRALAPIDKSVYSAWSGTFGGPPGPGIGQQDSDKATHQVWPSSLTYNGAPMPDPLVYQIKLQVDEHAFTTSQVLPIGPDALPRTSFDASGRTYAPGTLRNLPASTIYGFNGTFPGPRINAEYGRPALVRFENHLDENPKNLDRQDFGAPDWAFLTHLHNGHTAPESDGNPNYRHQAYQPKQWVDNLYLNYPAGGDDSQKQSFFWFHDHRMDHTGANVYKGMAGLFPIYGGAGDPDNGDERTGFRLPGVRTNNPDGSFDVDYDIPLVFYDARLEDGFTPHKDFHTGNGEFHPEWWGKSYFRHFPNHGFVGDVFTVNGTAYPVLEVMRRKYRLRFLDASISRIYEFKLMSSSVGPKAAKDLGYSGDELQGQWRIPDGQQCMKFTQVANEGGLLAAPIVRDSFELWPAKRREFIVDFTTYQDGSPTRKGDVIYLTNVIKMTTGRMWDNSSRFAPDPAYKIPMLKIVIGDDPPVPDASQIPTQLRPIPALPSPTQLAGLIANRRVFNLQRGSFGGEIEWLINNQPFNPTTPLAQVKGGPESWEAWEMKNGGGGWVHPLHIHMEEHRVVIRNGKDVTTPEPGHPDDAGKEDVVALDPAESVIFVRRFRTFKGKYVCHCHNLAHEDHAMMFGWEIV